jgi:hypothetical protein
MTDKRVLWIRILIASITFVALSGTLVSFYRKWYFGLINTVLFLLSFYMLANGVSYLSEILKKDKKYLKILTGIFSIYIVIFIFIPQNQDASPLIGWTTFIGLSSSSILVSIFSVLELAQIKKRFRWIFSILFALFSGISSCIILSFIYRGYNHSEAGLFFIGYGAIIFLVSMTVNLITLSSLKNKIR